MKKIKFYRIFAIIAIPAFLTLSFVLLYIKPALATKIPDYRYLFFWIAFASVGRTILNFRYFSIIEDIKDEKKINELLSRRGKYLLKKDPSEYFSEELLARYFTWQKQMITFFLTMVPLMYIALNFQSVLHFLLKFTQ